MTWLPQVKSRTGSTLSGRSSCDSYSKNVESIAKQSIVEESIVKESIVIYTGKDICMSQLCLSIPHIRYGTKKRYRCQRK